MDPLSITAGIAGLLATTQQVTDALRKVKGDVDPAEFGIYTRILTDVGKDFAFGGPYPKLAGECLSLCNTRLNSVVGEIEAHLTAKKPFKPNDKELKDAVKRFIDAVRIFRDVVTDAYTHEMLRRQADQQTMFREGQMQILALVEFLETRLKTSSQVSEDEARFRGLADELRSSFRPMPSWQPDDNDLDPFAFSATILRAHEDDTDPVVVRGKMDSGCDENWVALEILQRGNLQDDLEPVENGQTYSAFGGDSFLPLGRINITWYALNAVKSRTTTFLVHEDPPFDFILGRVFIAKESVFIFDKAALALRHGNFTQAEHRAIEENARNQGATREQLAQIRRADEAAARERRRQQKTVSRMSMTPAGQSTVSLSSHLLSNTTHTSGSHPPSGSRQPSTLSRSSSVAPTQNAPS